MSLTLEELEPHYDKVEFQQLLAWDKVCIEIGDPEVRGQMGREFLRSMWPDELTYIQKTHFIKTKDGRLSLLVPNYAQKRFYEDVIQRCRRENRPIRGTILKARQLGFSTFIQSWQYEQCDRNRLRTSMTVSYDDPSTEELFQKAHLLHNMQVYARPKKRSRKNSLEFEDNKSVFYARTAGNLGLGRSFTFQHLHNSEIPWWPDAEQTLLALNQAVPAQSETSVFDESTARGAVGPFYEKWQRAEAGESDFIPFFAPWFWDPHYTLPFPSEDHKRRFARTQSSEDRRYQQRFGLDMEQMHWRSWCIRNNCGGSIRKFQQEYPASATEAFLTTGSPVFDVEKILALEDNVRPAWFVGEVLLQKQ